MKKEKIVSQHVAEPKPGLWSNCLRLGEDVYVSGMTARAMDGETLIGDNEYDQSKAVFEKIKNLVEAAGGQMNDVVKMTIFVTNIRKNSEVWRARSEFFSGDFPACTLVEVSALAKPEILVEIEAFARLGCAGAQR